MQDVIISLDEKSILDAIKKLGVKFEKNEDIRIYDQDNLMIIINFGKFNKFGVKRAKKDRGLISYKAKTLAAYAIILADAREKLDEWVKKMYKAFNLIHGRCKKRHQRGNEIKLIGVKSLECNFNPIKKTYNPHFHIIVPNAEVAHLLRKEWIEQWRPIQKANCNYNKYKYTNPAAQDIRKINDLEHALIETIKYGSKIFTEPDLKKKSRLPEDHTIYASTLHNIFSAMQGKRLFDRFGFNVLNQTNKSTLSNWVNNYEKWEYSTQACDWVNESTGETLTGSTSGAQGVISRYRPNPNAHLTQLLEYADVNDTIDDFFKQFRNTFLQTLPNTLTNGLDKRQLTKNITNTSLDKFYLKLMKSDQFYGGKLIGVDGGGFF